MLLDLPNQEEERDIRLVLLYYLIAAFTIFVCELPGHPVGTPFPGGSSSKNVTEPTIAL